MNKEKRGVKAESSENGYVIFRLLEGNLKIRTVMTFGFGSRNNLWVRIIELADRSKAIMPENAFDAKAEIAAWMSR